MQVNINHEKSVNGFAERTITVDLDEFNEITLALKLRFEELETRLENYKNNEDEGMKKFIPKTEEKIERLKSIIDILQ